MKRATYSGSWMHRGAFLALLALSGTVQAQQGSSGNTYIFGGAQMTFFGPHDFVNGGSSALPGIIGTVRTDPNGVLNFAATASHTGASDAAHVDGYVRKYGTSQFVFRWATMVSTARLRQPATPPTAPTTIPTRLRPSPTISEAAITRHFRPVGPFHRPHSRLLYRPSARSSIGI
ncbi:MAG TPA: hypothetical protein VN038_23450 [Dyadobacter sp.]|nr:hypothetical protein [Dyadobacter sp.]